MGLEEEVISVLKDVGDSGATASQIARKLGRKREVTSHYLWILKKMGKVTNRSRNLWVLIEKGLDPFNIPLKEFENLSLDEYVSLSEKAHELCKGKIKEAFKDGNVHHIVICEGEIVYRSSNIAGIPSHMIKNLMIKLNKPCYIFSKEDMVEEAQWIKLDTDYYPTVKLLVGGETWNDEKVVNEGKRVLADFDTGNPHYTILNEKFSEGIAPPPLLYESHRGIHLGKPYWYFLADTKICIKDIEEALGCKVMPTRFVRLWEKSPLLLPNPRREGFVGRNLMLTFNFKITLNPSTHTSALKLLT